MAAGKTKTALVENDELKPVVSDDETEDDLKARQEQRRNEWGTQFDRWLIRAATQGRQVEVWFNPTADYVVCGVPKRIDKYMVQFEINGEEIWLNKKFFFGCRQYKAQDDNSPAEE